MFCFWWVCFVFFFDGWDSKGLTLTFPSSHSNRHIREKQNKTPPITKKMKLLFAWSYFIAPK